MEVVQTTIINWYIWSDMTVRGDVDYGESNYRVYYFRLFPFKKLKKNRKRLFGD
jgi:hypothetical protein